MKQSLFSFLLVCSMGIALRAQAPSIVVQNPATTTPTGTYTSFAAAVAAASPGDYLYCSGGIFSIGTFNLDKQLNIIGAGYNLDSASATGITVLDGYLHLLTGAGSGSLEGVYMPEASHITMGDGTANATAPTNYAIRRCNVQHIAFQYCGIAGSGYYIGETIVRGTISGQWNGVYAQNVFLDKCILMGSDNNNSALQGGMNGVLFKHCVIGKGDAITHINHWDYSYWNRGCNAVSNCIFQNCVLLADDVFGCGSGNLLQNCLMLNDTDPNGEVNQNTNPVSAPSRLEIFENVTGPNYSASYNYQLKSTCSGKNAATDGTDIGIYGSPQPFRARPSNPQLIVVNISPATDAQGNLNMTIQATVGQ